MSNTVQHKRSNTHGATPTTSDLAVGEIGINTHDSKLFTNNGSSVVELGGIQNVSEDTSPSLGGDLTISGYDVNLAGTDKVTFSESSTEKMSLYYDTVFMVGDFGFIDSQKGIWTKVGDSTSDFLYWTTQSNTVMGSASAPYGWFLYHNGTQVFKTISNGVEVSESSHLGRFGGDGSTGGTTVANGYIDIKGKSVSEATYVNFYCESSNAHAVKLQAPAHSDFSGNITATLPNVTGTLVTSNAQQRIEVVSALPSSPDANTIYFVT